MFRKTLIATTTALMGTAAIGTAMAAENDADATKPPLRAAVMFNLLDENSDGSLDATEIGKVASAIVAAVDTDGDATLTQTELDAAVKGMMGRGSQRFGRGPGGDHDGFRGPRGRHDGRQRFGRGPRYGDHNSMGQRFGRGEMRQELRMRAAERFGIDEDGLTQQEFIDRQNERFAALDADGDGIVAADEFAAARPQFRGRQGAR